ncbi:MAG TPA: DUF3618 domain-containing protein [Pyrinomonadaceae bacterium]|nr:DUF3618 domain-containing protein [Pyrinomonadaceae bacterium]
MGEATDKIGTSDWDNDRTTSTNESYSTIASGSAEDTTDDTEQIRAEIEDTRAEMSQTINEIQERLSPDHLVGQVKESVREATIGKVERVMEQISEATEPARQAMGRAGTAIAETGRTVGNSVWRNPIPVALIGLGVGLLVMRKYRSNGGDGYERPRVAGGRRRSMMMDTDYESGQMRYGEQYGTGTRAGTQPGMSSSGMIHNVRETASDFAHRSTEAFSNLTHKARDTASGLGTRCGELMRSNPLAMGAVAVAAGTAVGLMLPSTRFETEYIGEAGERLADRAQEMAREAIDKVQDAAQQMTGSEDQQQQGQQGQQGQQPPPQGV